jgi:hypothetical protein
MCAAVSFEVKPLNVTSSRSVPPIGSSTIVTTPVPGEALAGFSFKPERFVMKVIGFAWASGDGIMNTEAITNTAAQAVRSCERVSALRPIASSIAGPLTAIIRLRLVIPLVKVVFFGQKNVGLY